MDLPHSYYQYSLEELWDEEEEPEEVEDVIKAVPSSYHQYFEISSLTSFLKKDSCFPLNEKALSQSHQLKEAFTTAPILPHFNPSLPTILETDASDYAKEAVLSKFFDSGKHPIAFDSRKDIPAEINYEINDKELLGIV
ncbi:hypothetical protein O181_077206 [Austropuccinia psidii MF-1]|uniref:Reverse transcriptase/retrotransposon-derived protein RNase H-like domain-containing protein n=1 Tax=Austropuccinia psidii MF-1 TaxID=1389203 RepID=A0A9Q3IBW2_9BASI|nr:hypothetical protein [Austropuccinia psidii MF-1]